MARVKTFRIGKEFGVPDREISEFLSACERDQYIDVTATYIPSTGTMKDGTEIDARINIIVTAIDEKE